MIVCVRRATAVLAALSCTLGGCGGSSPRPSLTPAQTAWAKRVNLRAADVPYLSARKIGRQASVYGPFDPAVERCNRGGSGDQLPGLASPRFSSSDEHTNQHGVSVVSLLPFGAANSTVYFAPTAATAARVVAAVVKPRGERCLARDFERSSKIITDRSSRAEPAFTNVRVTSSNISAAGARATQLQTTAVDRAFSLPGRPTLYTERLSVFAVAARSSS